MYLKLNSKEEIWVLTICLCGPVILIGYIVSIIKTFRDRQMILTIQKKRNSIERRRLTVFGSGSFLMRVKRSPEPRERESDRKDNRKQSNLKNILPTSKTKGTASPHRKSVTAPKKSVTSPRKLTTPELKEVVKAAHKAIIQELEGIPNQEVKDSQQTEELQRAVFDNSKNPLDENLEKDVTNNALAISCTETDLKDGDGDKKCTCGSGGGFVKCKFKGYKAIEGCSLPNVPPNIRSGYSSVSTKACFGSDSLQTRLT